MAKRSPNSEQKVAIEHHGGVLLSAGAGSGKTFVLVEHIIYLVDKFYHSKSFADFDEFQRELKGYLGSIVLMTFTKKAAGELSLRIQERFLVEKENSEQPEVWDVAAQALDAMSVSTIHGFCYKVLRQGFLPDFNPQENILFEVESANRIEVLFVEFISQVQDTEFRERLIKDQAKLRLGIQKIFESPELRIWWEEMDPSDLSSISLGLFFTSVWDVLGIQELFTSLPDTAAYLEYKKAKWFQFLEEFSTLVSDGPIANWDSYLRYQELLGRYKVLRAPKADLGLVEIEEFLLEVKKLKAFVKSYHNDLEAFNRAGVESLSAWVVELKAAFDYISESYKSVPGISFSDMEYYLLKGLKNPEVQKQINQIYSYFIIDEFQDTSLVQLDIIRHLIAGDFSKLFCVGDMKQAIYGFRGGELQVFKDVMKNVPRNLTMSNNYRSLDYIIHCNNYLFEFLFEKGNKFEGIDPHRVPVVYQTVPLDRDDKGALRKVSVEVEVSEGQKVSSTQMDLLEARAIQTEIQKIEERYPGETICILYRKLAPALFLMDHLVKSKNSVSSQMKIKLLDDPVIVLFQLFLTSLKETDDERQRTHLLIWEGVLRCLLSDLKPTLASVHLLKEEFIRLGMWESFLSLLGRLGLSNSNWPNNAALVKSICALSRGNPERALQLLDEQRDATYSLEFQKAGEGSPIVIMTAHASKGLEFEHVILGGIHTNGRSRADSDYIGGVPGSFKWKESLKQIKPWKSPFYILENLIQSQKDFAESKRLFYVACTRAEKTLTWIDLNSEGKPLSYSKESWIVGLRLFENSLVNGYESVYEEIRRNQTSQQLSFDLSPDEILRLTNPPSLIFHDDMGVSIKDSSLSILVGELSVTKLAYLSQCKRKYYFSNILKLDESLYSTLLTKLDDDLGKGKREEYRIDRDEPEPRFEKASDRGTRLHYALEVMTLRNCVIPRDIESPRDLKALEWITPILKELQETAKLEPEKVIKFPFFGHMVSGIIDLFIQYRDGTAAVWDYKTGKRKEIKEVSYLFQLKSYAYALYELGIVSKDESVELALIYLDELNIEKFVVTYNQVKVELFQLWRESNSLESFNKDYCEWCPYDQLCQEE